VALLHHIRCCYAAARVGLIVILGCLFVCRDVCLFVCGRAAAGCCIAAVRSRQDSGSRQTLLVLQFMIEFANICAQYSPSTYASTLIGFFDLCPNVQMAALRPWRIVPIWLVLYWNLLQQLCDDDWHLLHVSFFKVSEKVGREMLGDLSF